MSKMAETLDRPIQLVIESAVSWSRPCWKCKRWWTKDNTELKHRMAVDKLDRIKNWSSQEARTQYRKSANRWRKAIREAQWKYWEETFKTTNREYVHKAMKAPDKLRRKEGLPCIKGISSFQGECEILLDTFFPANVATLPPFFRRTGYPHPEGTRITGIPQSQKWNYKTYCKQAT